MEVTLPQMLEARERRAALQQELLRAHGLPLVCFTMNIAGPLKDTPLIRRGFELKTMEINGEYAEQPLRPVGEAAAYTWDFVLRTPAEKVFSFTLEPHALEEFSSSVEELKRYYLDREFKSLEILEGLSGGF